jgi:serine/threonine protein kinase
VGAQLASAVAHVHSRGIAHLDIKPANVLLSPDGGVRLADFGIARRAGSTKRPAKCTLLFAAPEVLASGAASTAADVWSFGVLVYTLLVGFPPFFPHAGGTGRELREQVRCANPSAGMV